MTGQESPADTIRQISLHQASLLAYIQTLQPDRSEAQDILQETNVVLWQKVNEFREVLEDIDPAGVMASDMSRRLGIRAVS